MKKNINITLLLGAFLLLVQHSKAQYVIKEADTQFELYNYEKAINLYEEAYQKKKSLRAAERLAESYRMMRDFANAESWYAISTQMEGAKAEHFRWYAEMLRSNAKYKEAKEQYTKYAGLLKNASEAQLQQINQWKQSCDSAMIWMDEPKRVNLNNEKALNTPQSDWAAVPYNKGLVFTSDRMNLSPQAPESKPFLKFDSDKLPDKRIYGWNGNSYLKLYQQDVDGNVRLFPLETGTDYHVGTATFDANEQEVYFTLTRIPKNIARVKNAPSTINIEIYSSRKDGDQWTKPVPFRYNNLQKWSVGDPFLTEDGDRLYFVSNMPGGKGGTDIYVCKRQTDGSWGEAENLEFVNTLADERFPVVTDGMLYFSSNGWIGMGGLDIYKTKLQNGDIENLGYPINSPHDDFAFRATGKLQGYFSSNREGGLGQDDIYSFVTQPKIDLIVQGKALNKETNLPLANAVVALNKADGTPIMAQTDKDGHFKFVLDKEADYSLVARKTNFMAGSAKFTTKGLTSAAPINQTLYLTPIVLNKAIRIDNIYYDFDKADIRPDAARELDKLVTMMKENPTIWIELGSHTDSRGNDKYNLRLSQNRAESAVQYIIAKGVEKNRIFAKGYGETVPVNGCVNGVNCSEAEHQLNRRTEIKIIKH